MNKITSGKMFGLTYLSIPKGHPKSNTSLEDCQIEGFYSKLLLRDGNSWIFVYMKSKEDIKRLEEFNGC